jgi:Ca2+-transporting ATPase
MKEFYQLTYEEVLKELGTSVTGLKKEEISSLQNKYGKNVLKETKQKSRLTIFLSQFKDVMIIILIVAAGISFAVGEHTDAYVILAIIIANAWIGYTQEYNAEESVRLLQKMSAQYALVLRDNNPEKLDAAELVPGDIS